MATTSLLDTLNLKRTKLAEKLAKLDGEINVEKKNIEIMCTGCKKTHRIGDLEYIQTHWYVRPYSCTGGDYWNEGEGQFRCPSCNIKNRLYNRKEYEELRSSFRNVVKIYESGY